VTAELRGRAGFEIELLAPPGRSRQTLAEHLAAVAGGRVRPVWHHDSEPSLVPGLGRFLHLTRGFEVQRADGTPVCTLVDDVTLIDDLDPRAAAPPGWFRILSDDARLLNLLAAQSDPAGELSGALDAAARLWGTRVQRIGDVYRLDDPAGATVALAAPHGGERERACEIVTPPLTGDHGAALQALLGPARALGFTVPAEAAVHVHFDGAPFRQPHALANVIRLFGYWRQALHALLRTNPACRRLAPLPAPLMAAAGGGPSLDDAAAGRSPSLEDLRRAAAEGGLSKFFDVNLTQLLTGSPRRDTIEVRILPGTLDADDVLNRAGLVELLLERCRDPAPVPVPPADPEAAMSALLSMAAEALAAR
jgi:hypothetical protein